MANLGFKKIHEILSGYKIIRPTWEKISFPFKKRKYFLLLGWVLSIFHTSIHRTNSYCLFSKLYNSFLDKLSNEVWFCRKVLCPIFPWKYLAFYTGLFERYIETSSNRNGALLENLKTKDFLSNIRSSTKKAQ